MAPTHPSQLTATVRELIVRITDIAIAAAAAAGREVDRSALLADLVALFDSQLAAVSPDDMRDALPPWKRFPESFSTRFDYIESVFESSETSSYYEAIPLDAPHDAARRKVRLLAQSYRNYPEE